jgi:DNA repair protein RadD
LTIKVGIYSAGLKRRDIREVTVAGIQSIYKKQKLFRSFDIIIVDECHTIPNTKNTMYDSFFLEVTKPVIGFTATPYRLGVGYLHIGAKAFFDDIVYAIPIKKLQKEGYLCKLTSKATKKRLEANDIRKQAGDFVISELSKAFDRDRVTDDIIEELILYKDERKKWLIFTIDIEHCEHVTEKLRNKGISAAFVHSKMSGDRAKIIEDFKKDKYQALVSVAVLTTGFDVPSVDLIGLLRPTASPVLHVQIIGRGLRIAEGKENCLVLDFAGNLMRNGPIDAPVVRVKGSGTGEAIMKECNNCWEIVHAAVRICPACGQKFQFRHKLSSNSQDSKIVTMDEWYDVTDVKYFNYVGSRDIPMLKVSYFAGLKRFSEYVCLEHPGYAAYRAAHWWKRRSDEPVPKTAEEALKITDTLREPKRILVNESGNMTK